MKTETLDLHDIALKMHFEIMTNGGEFPDVAHKLARIYGVDQAALEAAYDELTD
jgi:hypothetical protein